MLILGVICNILTGTHLVMLTYTELKAFVCKTNVKSRNDYKQLYASQSLPEGAPESPEKEYAEFEGWRAFLGKKVDT